MSEVSAVDPAGGADSAGAADREGGVAPADGADAPRTDRAGGPGAAAGHAAGTFAAVDLGASSGRVMVGRVGAGTLRLTEAHRFPNRPVCTAGTLHWDILALYAGVLDGLRAAGAGGVRLDSVGIDGWAVDHGLLDADGRLLGNPVHYRDRRTEGVAEKVWTALPAARLYAATGIQYAPFNTLYQLVAAAGTAQLAAAKRLLMIPDLIAYWLTGEQGTEITNASTTQLMDPRTGGWAEEVARAAGVDLGLFAPLRSPGDQAGTVLPEVLRETGLAGPVPVTAVGSHDTASAVAAVPAADGERFAYICTGTWSLAGLELGAPVLTEASRAANFTNELGIDGTVRFLRNITGLWLLQECMREWGARDVAPLLRAAAGRPGLRSVVDACDPAFLAPGGMPARIAAACRTTGQPVPEDPAAITRCVLDSLAMAHRAAVLDAQRLAGRPVDVVHVVGGGARNGLLCRLTADACGLPVVAGPPEAAALGNVLVQARARGLLPDRAAARSLVARTQPLTRHLPSGGTADWVAAARRIAG
jgi:rhamnulokinase